MLNFNLKKKEEKLVRENNAFIHKLESMQQELDIKSKLIFKLQLEVSEVKFEKHQSKPKLAICNVSQQNIPAEVKLPLTPKPIPILSCVTLKSTCDTPECQQRHRPCFYTGMPKPWFDPQRGMQW